MRESRLREFVELVLLSVLIQTPNAYGAALQETLASEANRDVSLGAIYTALERLGRRGLVVSELGDPTPVRGGRRKRHYSLTPLGLAHVKEARRVRERLWSKATSGLRDREATP